MHDSFDVINLDWLSIVIRYLVSTNKFNKPELLIIISDDAFQYASHPLQAACLMFIKLLIPHDDHMAHFPTYDGKHDVTKLKMHCAFQSMHLVYLRQKLHYNTTSPKPLTTIGNTKMHQQQQ